MSKKDRPVIAADRIFYWAYGSNLSIEQMKKRCPKAIKYGPMTVKDCALVFRFHADVTICEGASTPGGLWQITTECEQALDVFEGVASRRYMKKYFRIRIKDKYYTCLFYQMRTKEGVMAPSVPYFNTILTGYEDFGLDAAPLEAALTHAWQRRRITEELSDRRVRSGHSLARPLKEDPLSLLEHMPSQGLLPPPMWEE
jgi:hypothetical protein